jgi:EmrB/QacA subfamily drug resistance transporter
VGDDGTGDFLDPRMTDGPDASPPNEAQTPAPTEAHGQGGDLRAVDGPDVGSVFRIDGETVIGREDSADLTLSDPTGEVSRQHAVIRWRGGTAWLEDLSSTNGTFLNGERLRGPQPLRAGAKIRIGACTFEFTPDPPVVPPAPAPLPASDLTAERPIPDIDVTRARPIPGDLDSTRARPIPTDLDTTRARPIPTDPDSTRARPIPTELDTTRARPIPTDLDTTRARPIPTELDTTRARPIPTDLDTTRARPIQPPPDRAPTYSPSGADGDLRILSGPGVGTEVPVSGGSATIGREPECDLQVLDSEVSRRHAKITIRDGSALIDDLHSANGTYVNGERIVSQYRLAPGDHIEIGEATIALTSPVFQGSAIRTLPPQVSAVRDVVVHPVELLETGSRKWWTLAAVCLTTFMLLLDITIVSVALPTISRSLHPSFANLQWIVDAYSLMLAACLLTAGSVADIVGRRRVIVIGQIVFIIGSVGCAFAASATMLDLTRGLQGIGGAMMFACALALIVQEFPAHERGIAFGVYGAVNSLSVAVGPILGAILTEEIGWQAIFFLNVPVGCIALYILLTKVVNLPGPPTKVDWGGLVTFSVGLVLIIYGVIGGNTYGWTSTRELVVFAAGIALLIAFIPIELHREHPMFDLRLFRLPTFNGVSLAAFTLSASVIATFFFLTTWLQSIQGFSALGTGIRLLPLTVVALLVAPGAGRMVGKIHPRLPIGVGLGIIAIGFVFEHRITATSTWTVLLPGLVLCGLGMGAVNPSLGATAVAIVPPWRGGMAGGISQTWREFGVTAGVAGLGALLQHQVRTHLAAGLAHTAVAGRAGSFAAAISVGGTPNLLAHTPAAQRPLIHHLAVVSYAAGLKTIFLVGIVLALIGCIGSFALIRRRDLYQQPTAGGGH